MKNKLTHLFQTKKKGIRSVYFTAGYPLLSDTPKIIAALEKTPIDMVEIGIPFSDPLADGPVIQNSSKKALENGMNLSLLFDQLGQTDFKTDIPLILMGYLNPILQFGENRFLEKCKEIGISGLIVPDLPLKYYHKYWAKKCEALALPVIFLITPQTAPERIREIDKHASGFIYMVSTSSLTGTHKDLKEQKDYFARVQKMQLQNPLMIGFGIRDKKTMDFALSFAQGAIIGSAFMEVLRAEGSLNENINRFIHQVL